MEKSKLEKLFDEIEWKRISDAFLVNPTPTPFGKYQGTVANWQNYTNNNGSGAESQSQAIAAATIANGKKP